MRGSFCGILALILTAGLTSPVMGQMGGVQTGGGGDTPPVRQPQHYTAEFKDRSVQKLANGAKIILESTSVLAEDTHGRTLHSNTDSWGYGEEKSITRVSVFDPVAGTTTIWTSPGTTATVITREPIQQEAQSGCFLTYTTPNNPPQVSQTGSRTGKPAQVVAGLAVSGTQKAADDPDHAQRLSRLQSMYTNSVVKDLGTKKIHGVLAHGKRFAWTTPTGAVGNNEPLVHTQETWITTGDNPRVLNVREVAKDPQSGKSTMKLVRLSLDEPDLSVFQPPKGYEIVTEAMHHAPCPSKLAAPER